MSEVLCSGVFLAGCIQRARGLEGLEALVRAVRDRAVENTGAVLRDLGDVLVLNPMGPASRHPGRVAEGRPATTSFQRSCGQPTARPAALVPSKQRREKEIQGRRALQPDVEAAVRTC